MRNKCVWHSTEAIEMTTTIVQCLLRVTDQSICKLRHNTHTFFELCNCSSTLVIRPIQRDEIMDQDPGFRVFQCAERTKNPFTQIAMTCVKIRHTFRKTAAQHNANTRWSGAGKRELTQACFSSAARRTKFESKLRQQISLTPICRFQMLMRKYHACAIEQKIPKCTTNQSINRAIQA